MLGGDFIRSVQELRARWPDRLSEDYEARRSSRRTLCLKSGITTLLQLGIISAGGWSAPYTWSGMLKP